MPLVKSVGGPLHDAKLGRESTQLRGPKIFACISWKRSLRAVEKGIIIHTGDIASLDPLSCSSGRETARLARKRVREIAELN